MPFLFNILMGAMIPGSVPQNLDQLQEELDDEDDELIVYS